MIFPKKIFPLFALLFLVSCADNLDFDQINDYKTTPIIKSSLAYFTIVPSQVFNTTRTPPILELIDESEFRIFDNRIITDKLVKIDFDVLIKNESDKDFTLQVEFLDDNRTLTHRFNEFEVKTTDANYPNFAFKETIEVSANPNLVNTTRIRIAIKIEDTTTPINTNDTSKFELKSSATIYLDTDG